jgi:hypothetical protein
MVVERLLLISLALALVGAGCNQVGSELPTPTASLEPLQAATAGPERTEAPSPTAAPTTSTAGDASDLDPDGPIPVGSSALRSSDPDSFRRAAGEPQLVEFFAFW